MKISWQWLSELVDLSSLGSGPDAPAKLAEILTARGLEVESVDRRDKGFEKVVTAQILERNKHPEADRLSLCKVTTGSGAPLEIVCGAQNMKAGDRVALAQIGASLPNGLTITQSKIRGVVSSGMLCSEEELKLKDKSEGILILPADTPLGKPLAELLGLDDTILAFKLTANRGDCLSHFGMAREVAAALGVKAKRPKAMALDWKGTQIQIGLEAQGGSRKFYGVSIEGVKIGPSPAWVGKRLEALGSRSINNVVDASNLVMLELGHPTHAYDATQIKGGKIRVRMAKAGEKLPLLDGTEVTLAGSELAIADAERAIGLAGVMGGGNSEVRDGTTKLYLECAEFSPSLVRKASSKHQKKTDAAHRFERGVDIGGMEQVMGRLAQLITEWAGGKVTGSARATDPTVSFPAPHAIRVDPSYFGSFLGMDVSADQAEKIFKDLECEVVPGGKELVVTPPSFRLDLRSKEDLAEEIARTIGYDKIQSTVPPLSGFPTAPGSGTASATAMAELALIDRAKDSLVRSGLNEALNFSFTSQAWLAKTGFPAGARVINPLSEEVEALVPSLLPGLLQSALGCWHRHFGSESLPIRLFELRPTFHTPGEAKVISEMETSVTESWKLALLLSGPRYREALRSEKGEVDFYDLKAVVENLLETLGTRGARFVPLAESRTENTPSKALFHPGQSVEVLAGKDGAGFVGLLHPGKARELKMRAPVWLAELDWKALSKLSRPVAEPSRFRGWSEFPSIERDFALLVKGDTSADRITQVALKAGKPLAKVAKIFDVYRGSQVAEGM
ncbi:MAG TPA: phenylalanine--tRNA ligase subunit beta, partial [Bdellovibrionota bacterium]|nr:phenylalanine--tRNA ligase subunit beta [Bdellovibrionota bacterium]